MSIRIVLLTLLVAALAVYAWRDWFVSLCGLILLMAVIQHPDMPKNIGGIQGLNPWNILMVSILLAWFVQRRNEGFVWDLPLHITVMLLLYLAVIIVGVIRMLADRSHMEEFSTEYLISETLINCIKWMVPGLLLFDGCRNPRRFRWALSGILAMYFLLAVQVIRWIPPGNAATGDELSRSALKLIQNEIGYSRVNMSMMLSGASWAILAAMPLVQPARSKAVLVAGFLLVAYAQALTGGRMGYVTWGVVGLVLCLTKWRKGLLLFPGAALLICLAAPGVVDRMLEGFGQSDVAGESYADDSKVTSGRTLIWPHVIDAIKESPAFGYGRMGMNLTGLSSRVVEGENGTFPHPHNAYLEFLLDNGAIGFVLVMPFYVVVLLKSFVLFRDNRYPLFAAAGGMACALLLALLVAAMGSQTFYPREGALGMWATMGLVLRAWQVRSQRQRQVLARNDPEVGGVGSAVIHVNAGWA